jgi:hypothetical protein
MIAGTDTLPQENLWVSARRKITKLWPRNWKLRDILSEEIIENHNGQEPQQKELFL